MTGVLKDMVAASGIAPSRIEVTPNGIEAARFAAASRQRSGPIVLGFVGFVRRWHGLHVVIEALAHGAGLPGMQLVVVGEGPARPELERQAAALGVAARVRFTGLAAPEAIPELVAGFDIALQPQVVAYASPLKILEYMAAARAIVAPDQPNIREILEHGRTALLFDPAQPDGLWQAIRRLAEDPPLRERLGAAAHEEIRRRDYSWRRNAAQIVALAQADLGRRSVAQEIAA